jgi:hypothetical protein
MLSCPVLNSDFVAVSRTENFPLITPGTPFSAMFSPNRLSRGAVKLCWSRRSKSKKISLKQCVGTMLPLMVASLYSGHFMGSVSSAPARNSDSLPMKAFMCVAHEHHSCSSPDSNLFVTLPCTNLMWPDLDYREQSAEISQQNRHNALGSSLY